MQRKVITTSSGAPIDDNQNSMTAGPRGPILAQVFLRFSTVAGERGANDCDRDPRGFAIKHFTEEGNYDMVGNNTPVFFIKDPIKFPDFIHS